MNPIGRLCNALGCRPWNLSLISMIVLAFSNMLLTFLLLQSENCRSSSSGDYVQETNGVTEWDLGSKSETRQDEEVQVSQQCSTHEFVEDGDILRMDPKLGRWDARRIYKTFDGVLTGSLFPRLSETHKVCLATQSSVERLHSIVQVAHHWTGPISLALYAAGDDEFEVLQRYLAYLRKCYAPIRERIFVSLVLPKARLPRRQPRSFDIPDSELDCASPEYILKGLLKRIPSQHNVWRAQNVYPQNHLRNLARKNCQTDYVFLTDVDVIPSYNLTRTLDSFLRSSDTCDKCAYVIPTYELDTRIRFPQNKSELVRLAKKGLARPFHEKVFIHNQFATNFSKWILDVSPGFFGNKDHLKTGKVYVSHDVTNFELFYEPFYVAKDTVPSHDERFMGYGYTRNTQVYEMFVAGYQFKVLSPVFTGHWGLQSKRGRPAWRERQNNFNRNLFEAFKKEVFARYMRDPLKLIKTQKSDRKSLKVH
ncbi:beta-1,4-glucuronyltransferase 1 isoform X2 [Orussus abietinus]|uniref:beta-1,4-glucuronyltransferase 1 isoform X2 n=1 Tax=Orussus abietinus TaxID=222816 RepID=UPI000624FE7F|nr:beta-1,4-glucuronyltransferase 1 isoform X2 [Orussus abietinus]